MKLIYSGKTKEFTPELEQKISAKLAKLSKMIEQRGEREAHVMHQVERHLHRVEIVVNFYDHALVGEGTDADLACSLNSAVEKLEKQVVKLRTRWRDTHRDPKAVRDGKEAWESAAANNGAVPPPVKTNGVKPNGGQSGKPRIFQVNYDEDSKPMTLEEAMIEMQATNQLDYVVYRDSDHRCLSVLIRRSDGHYDLIRS